MSYIKKAFFFKVRGERLTNPVCFYINFSFLLMFPVSWIGPFKELFLIMVSFGALGEKLLLFK